MATVATHPAPGGRLIAKAVRVSDCTPKRAATQARTEGSQRSKQEAILDLFGKMDMLPAAEMKCQRRAAQDPQRDDAMSSKTVKYRVDLAKLPAPGLGQLWNLPRLQRLDQMRARHLEQVRRLLGCHGIVMFNHTHLLAGQQQARRRLARSPCRAWAVFQ